jgi:hypothetical protein
VFRVVSLSEAHCTESNFESFIRQLYYAYFKFQFQKSISFFFSVTSSLHSMAPVLGGGRAAASAVLVLSIVSATVLVELVSLRVRSPLGVSCTTGKECMTHARRIGRICVHIFIRIIHSHTHYRLWAHGVTCSRTSSHLQHHSREWNLLHMALSIPPTRWKV